ncbi:Ociad1 family protein [Megaselia abdita]
MERPPPAPYQDQNVVPHRGQNPNPLAGYQFSHEEMKVLAECNRESFFQRSLPLGTMFGVGAYLGVKQGFLSANAKYGSVPKIVLGVIVGYFAGKFSYQQKCAEKIMRLPNSRLGEVLRQRQRGGGAVASMLPMPNDPTLGVTMSPFASSEFNEEKDSYNRSSVFNMDVERPTNHGLDDTYRPNLDSTPQTFDAELPLETPKHTTSYDELRQKNREEYMKRQSIPPRQTYAPQQLPQEAPVYRRPPPPGDENSSQPKTNKYGDSWSS